MRGITVTTRRSVLPEKRFTRRTSAATPKLHARCLLRASQTRQHMHSDAHESRCRPTEQSAKGACARAPADAFLGGYDQQLIQNTAERQFQHADGAAERPLLEPRAVPPGYVFPFLRQSESPRHESIDGFAESQIQASVAAGQVPAYLLGIRTVSRFRPFLRRRLSV